MLVVVKLSGALLFPCANIHFFCFFLPLVGSIFISEAAIMTKNVRLEGDAQPAAGLVLDGNDRKLKIRVNSNVHWFNDLHCYGIFN